MRQSLSGTISGTVADEQGGALPGADVILTDQTSRAVQRTTTNAEGVFVFAAVPAGTYTVKVELQNFNSWEATDIALRLGERRSVTGIKLKMGTLERNGVGHRQARNRPARFRREERAPDVGADSERADGRTVDGRAAQAAARHDADLRTGRATVPDSTARSSGSTATATAASRAPSAISPATAPAPTRSTSSSTAPMPPIPAATAPRR